MHTHIYHPFAASLPACSCPPNKAPNRAQHAHLLLGERRVIGLRLLGLVQQRVQLVEVVLGGAAAELHSTAQQQQGGGVSDGGGANCGTARLCALRRGWRPAMLLVRPRQLPLSQHALSWRGRERCPCARRLGFSKRERMGLPPTRSRLFHRGVRTGLGASCGLPPCCLSLLSPRDLRSAAESPGPLCRGGLPAAALLPAAAGGAAAAVPLGVGCVICGGGERVWKRGVPRAVCQPLQGPGRFHRRQRIAALNGGPILADTGSSSLGCAQDQPGRPGIAPQERSPGLSGRT